jgi:Thiol-disulfide isomerase and thioredoxins
VQLSDFRGEKPVFINFWATWCPPCMREMPEMQRLYAARGDEFEILAVNFLEHRPQVIPWVEEYGLEFPILMDVTGEVSSRYGVWSYPTSVFIDKDGIVRGRFVGELSYQMMEDFVDAISEYKAGDT